MVFKKFRVYGLKCFGSPFSSPCHWQKAVLIHVPTLRLRLLEGKMSQKLAAALDFSEGETEAPSA